MKFASATLFPISLPYHRKVTWADHSEALDDLLLLRIVSDDGITGVAEVTVKPEWYGTSFASLRSALEDIFLPMLRSIDLSDSAAFTEMASVIIENQIAKTVIDNALHDLRGARSDKPFWTHMNGEASVPSCWVLTRQAPELMASEAAEMVERYGFGTIKLKGGQGIDVDVQAVRAVRRTLGYHVQIFVDANWHYCAAQTPDYLAALAAEGVCAVEDPYALSPDREFERIQERSPIPMIVENGCTSLRDAKLFCERGARAIAVKPGRIGLSECARIADHAALNGCATHVGLAAESEVGSLAALSAAARLTTIDWLPAEATFFLLLRDRIVSDPVRIVDGAVELPNVSGLAELIDWNRVERLRR